MQDSVRGINFQINFFFALSFSPLFRGDLWKNHKIFSPAIDGSWPFTYIEVFYIVVCLSGNRNSRKSATAEQHQKHIGGAQINNPKAAFSYLQLIVYSKSHE